MTYETLICTTGSGVTTIALNRPDAGNGINAQMRLEIIHAVRHTQKNARVIVLTGSGPDFCTGQDLGERRTAGDMDLERVSREEYAPMLTAMNECPVPVITAVKGLAAGAGAALALATDVIFAAESASFVLPATRLGLIPDAGATFRLPHRVGIARAIGATFFADPIPARLAESWGMIWQCVPDHEFDETIRGRSAELASGPTIAYNLIRQAIRGSHGNDFATHLDMEAELQGQAGKTRDHREGVLAMAENRPPRFEGR